MSQEYTYWVPLKALLHGILAIVFSFMAYTKRVKSYEVSSFNGYCAYPSSSAWYYGILAALTLLFGQLTITYGIRCFCCRRRGVHFNRKFVAILAMIFFILSWCAFVISFIGLIYTAVVNSHKFLVKHHSQNNGGNCFIGLENLFLGAAIWCIITTVLGLITYAFWACSIHNKNTNCEQANYGQSGVAMGQIHTQLPKEQC
ncbi:uncharacterized protein LOC110728497 [Chenopodium quinoa]|uniref:uncharacterized protein LOC110728497 n=1 Tax=Chenopodium quinoa TaxID=63459 RepID=UPI000B76F2E0|nr:uncharacterized protein LOC110728497 [Chenopodium quinoa]